MSDAHEIPGFSLGTFEEPAEITLLSDITSDEYDEIDQALATVERLITTPFDYNLVERNFLNLESIHQFVTVTLSLGRQFATPDHKLLGDALMTSTVNWLTSMRLFLDHTETDLKRRFGKLSPEAQRFKAATSRSLDSRVGYRFAARFRNYVQHYGLPLSTIQVNPPSPNAGTGAVQSIELLLDRDLLLDSYNEWGPVKADLSFPP